MPRPVELLVIASLLLSTVLIAPAHAAGTVYVSPSAQPSATTGTDVTYEIKIADADPFTGWNVEVRVDPNVLLPKSISITGNLLVANFSASLIELANCVNGLGTGCAPEDGLGLVHSAAVAFSTAPLPATPFSGLLFTITYTAINNGSGTTTVDILRAAIINGYTGTVIPVSLAGGFYGDSPDFGVSIDPVFLETTQGLSPTLGVTLKSLNDFAGNVSIFADSILPAFADPGIGTLTPSADATSTMHLSTTACTSPGTYGASITATDGLLSHTFLSLIEVAASNVKAPDFCLDASFGLTLTVQTGSSNSSIVFVDSANDFAGTVSLTASVIPSLADGPFATVVPSQVSLLPGDSATVRLTVSAEEGTPLGRYTVVVRGSSGSVSHFAVVPVNVKRGPPDFSIALASRSMAVPVGLSLSNTVTLTGLNGFQGAVALGATIFPAVADGPSVDLSPSTVTISGKSASSVLTVSTVTATLQTTYIVAVTASSGSLSHTVFFTLDVISPVTPPTLVQLRWKHLLSLSKSVGTQTWLIGVSNPNPEIALFINVQIIGRSDGGTSAFSASSGPTPLPAGQSINIKISEIFTNADLGSTFNFEVSIQYGFTPTFLPLTSTESKGAKLAGSFTVVP